MNNLCKSLLGVLLIGSVQLNAQTTIHINSVPQSTELTDSLYLAGNINGWKPGDKPYRFEVDNNNEYWLTIDSLGYSLEYKITRGSWTNVECGADGDFFANRNAVLTNDTIHIAVENWEDKTKQPEIKSTANSQVSIFDSVMFMPQFNRHRRIWIYLPQDYAGSERHYPVLYMHDGQNVFDASTSFAGEWQVDETLSALEDEGINTAIVVAIDNGGEHRINEYSVFKNEDYGGGEGDAYVRFIVETLKPRIDSSFRTLTNAQHTAIMGSSMGGLISHYAHFEYPDVFGKAGIFSAAYWFSDEYFSFTKQHGKPETSKLYLLAGMQESDSANYTIKMDSLLKEMAYAKKMLKTNLPADGKHAEWFWAREFEEAFLWLFYED